MKINLSKAQDDLKIVLEKKGVKNMPIMPVTAAIDCSGSMESNYNSGNIQTVLEQLLAVALKFDDDGLLPVVLFSTSAYTLSNDLNINNVSEYLKSHIRRDGIDDSLWGGTDYIPAMRSIIEVHEKAFGGNSLWKTILRVGRRIPILSTILEFFNLVVGGEECKTPTVCFFITDGQPSEPWRHIVDFLNNTSNNYFWVIVCVETSSYDTKKHLSSFNNVDIVEFKNLVNTNSNLYENIISDKMIKWSQTFNQNSK